MANIKASQKQTDGSDPLAKGNQSNQQNKPDSERMDTVTPDNDNGKPGPPAKKPAIHQGNGSAGENL